MINVLAAVDFSDMASGVIGAAVRLIGRDAGKLVLLHVAAPDPDFVGYEVGPQSVRDARARVLSHEHAEIHRWAEQIQDAGVDCHGLLVAGKTAETIVREAERFTCSYVVLGSHGHGALYSALLGSTASDVLRIARCPVVVVPHQTADAAGKVPGDS